ncbi:helix-turn-helix transcriptional regulator [Staphylococcus sp. HKU1]|uniref:helix-turn-helix domain-containing protein n=1 Tax=Staphylococcus sp. HKU1 TaxID=3068989 RepID=UPI003AAFE674
MSSTKEEEFAKIIKETRLSGGVTLDDLAKFVGVSDVYISRIENAKRFPSKKVLFPLLLFIEYEEYTGDLVNKLLTLFSTIKDINHQDLENEYQQYRNDFKQNQIDLSNKIKNHQLEVSIDKFNKVTSKTIDKPYYDLSWLLTQEEYVLFFSDIETNNNEYFKHSLTDKDKQMIYNVVKNVLKRVYENQ